MPPALRTSVVSRLGASVSIAFVAALWLAIAIPVQAQTVVCKVGQDVRGEMGGGVNGKIAEIGTEPPHVGWYRLVFSWNTPKGDWYDPSTWKVYPVGSTIPCEPPKPPSPPKPAAPVPSPTVTPAKSDDDAPATVAPSKTPTAAPAAGTPALPSTQNCPAGTRVTDRQDRSGSITGERNGMCVIRLDDGETRSYLAWMLTKEGAAGPGPEDLAPGSYSCSAGSAGTFTIVIRDGSTYVDRAGKPGQFSLTPASGEMTLRSGSLAGQYGRLLGPGKFGLSSAPAKSLCVVCNRR